MNNDIEKTILAKGKTAPRITPDDIEANIVSQVFFTASQGVLGAAVCECAQDTKVGDVVHEDGTDADKALEMLTFCVLVLKNGFTVHGHSACASPENFDAEIGRNIARQNAVQKIWPLMGYELRTKLSEKVK